MIGLASNSFLPMRISIRRVVDLSHIIEPNIPRWTGDPTVEFEPVASLEGDGYYLRRFSLGEHSGTHINSPQSFYHDGASIEQYPAESLVKQAVVIDKRQECVSNSDYLLLLSDVLAWEEEYGEIPVDSLVLLDTGWQSKWSNSAAFFNQDPTLGYHFPGFGSEATEFLLSQRKIAGVGIDTHGVDGGMDTTFAINRLVLAQPRIVLENLTNLDQLPPVGSLLVIGVMRLQGGSGSPAGVLALIP
ncbi:MAG TPA: cyclase [Cyanobacteria bacterium UBA11159]|nr:cyclase [Cyanobacteria bacterium UBA11367]HBE60293.1 cyclase [Cyanobacteria bacterium UBA11366]HBK64051.1 cyclase [Cyanobacteria bacterium UBA11166]HBR72232.1 cyclase [Cyanobacteria bacterium UBA11159]HCA97307.1 cyclase [Cyanobacteria bacterium UBA9226]